MIKVSAIYPSGEGKTFDMDYYQNNHAKLLKNLLGDALKGAENELGLGSAEPGSTAPFIAIGCLYFENMSDFQNSFGANAPEIMADVPNYTNIQPMVQISEVQ